ncbi:MAG TPA: radical SAM protein [Acidobacteriaceae bacterium]|jgi:DNA repair photolyase|nr:radical SAM protein [Acidobacteriaceae bacterium]
MGEQKANLLKKPAASAGAEGLFAVAAAADVPALFPIVGQNSAARPVGIARLAAEGESAGERKLVVFRTLAPRSVLNRTVSKRMPWMTWTINPYRGCEFGCRYCYARYTHEFIHPEKSGAGGREPGGESNAFELFEREIYIKQHAAWLLRQELGQVRTGESIGLGTATDPYQPVERTAKVTRSLLEVLAERKGLTLGIVTKATLIERDMDLLVRIAERNRLSVCLTITTPDAGLARILEPRAPRPDLRFQTVERLRAAGLRVGILCSPLMPGITDTPRALEAMARRAKKAGACFFAAQPLFLKPCSKGVFLRFVREHFPALEPMYAARYGDRAFVSKAYRERVAALVKAVVKRHGLEARFEERVGKTAEPVWPVQGAFEFGV